uniref:CSON005945 protein n=1 Tax=Culicoides sonorensis TaxID=179676 RepID=A0A336MWM2_CULSO
MSFDELERVRSDLLATCSQETVFPPIVFPLNVADLNGMPEKVHQILEIYGYIDILINNAGLSVRGSVLECVDDVYIKLMMVNFFGTIKLTQSLLPSMIQRKQGRVVCIGSVQGKFALPNRSAYSASKHALQAFCDSLRAEVSDDGIKVTLISPGYIQTNLSKNALTGSGSVYGKLDETTAKGASTKDVAEFVIKSILRDEKDVPKWLTNPCPIVEDPKERLRKYIVEPDLPDLHDPKPYFFPAQVNLDNLFHVPDCPPSTTIVPVRDSMGNIVDYEEVPLEGAGDTATNSMSLQRAPGPKTKETRGDHGNFPFWPGGFDQPEKDILELEIDNYDFEHNLLTCPPGFDEGMTFGSQSTSKDDQIIDLLSILDTEVISFGTETDSKTSDLNETKKEIAENREVDELLENSAQTEVLHISETPDEKLVKTEWAEMLDVTKPVKDFHIKVPDPAHIYPFELDIFQKQAIIKLEEHNHVLVAAHTSAGKTVVAEYAIALSRRHGTRAIYTSPIKALSNQKYHDFKKTFGDVGLITGDIQIDGDSSCLIMTTEILKSMLYCGSDVTRDLEYVVFDEVHYLNDPERGHVWEEVFILLPDHVCIVMLSATIPNTIEFANWVGRTKRRKVFVMQTLKRPVPLQHFLYTGCGGKSRNDIFMIVNEKSEFSLSEYNKAKASKQERQKDMQKAHNQIKAQRHFNPQQEKTLWVGLVDYLRRNDKMPVIAFTLSRNRCDSNAEALSSTDLSTAHEKYKINATFQRCLQRLKPIDRQLPQVKQLQLCLERGVGIHHSGILPILKEVVEILFQNGLVKLLFATETFAMGVNMPARTVIFDSVKKFNGKETRPLEPAEYTQMAGRAGRRGLDKSGTVILICKQDVPPDIQLRSMILGKSKKLESQFRLTYAMILNLLRVEGLSVEDMMSHSFREFFKQSKIPEQKTMMEELESRMSALQKLGEHLTPLCEFYSAAKVYIKSWNEIIPKYITQQKIQNELKPGRILIISYKNHFNKLALLLTVPKLVKVDSQYKVFVLDNQKIDGEPSSDDSKENLWYKMLSLSSPFKKFTPDGAGGHQVLSIQAEHILEISKKTLANIEPEKILQNWDQRQIPRFKDTPPSASVLKALTDLKTLTDDYNKNHSTLTLVTGMQDLEMFESMNELKKLKQNVEIYENSTDIPNFEQEFEKVYQRKSLEGELQELRYKISKESLSLYPDYVNKVKVLQDLNYVDSTHQVTMKGRVACQMSQNELLITELIFRNILTELEPPEIAALLSALVFQEKTENDPKLTKVLEKGMQDLLAIDTDVHTIEMQYNVGSTDDTQGKDKLNFGLMEVVYEWARNKPFAEIMELTDCKEGIIVRCIQQLNEILKDVKDAARIIGNSTLPNKMEEASNAIKRDIVFAASLYTTDEKIFVGDEENA